jgi:nucleoside-diphosphate-sugar epimerase
LDFIMRVLVTGATGFIGSHVLLPLIARGFEVHTIGRTTPVNANVIHHRADLLDPHRTGEVVHAIRATHLVHLSWYAEPGRFWCARQNLDWVSASLQLARCFAEAGGQRLVVAGSCAEYAWGPNCLTEGESACNPASLYGASKDALHRLLHSFGDVARLSLSWGRVFFLYGPGEKTGRLVSDAITSLLAGKRFETSHGRQRRDFMHVEDVGAAFASLADSNVCGAVNIGSGAAIPVRAILEQIAHETGRSDLIAFGARPLSSAEPETIAASVKRLREEVGFSPKFDLARGIIQTVTWWRDASAGSYPPHGSPLTVNPIAFDGKV